jgi:bifunctional non-homologous end joining protein LigD
VIMDKLSRSIAQSVVQSDPRSFTIAMAKAGRERKILIDYLRNNRTNTSVAAYSTRARPGAPVSVPLSWDELSPKVRSAHYTVENLHRRLASLKANPWPNYWNISQRVNPDTIGANFAR